MMPTSPPASTLDLIGTAGQRLKAVYHLAFITRSAVPSVQLVNQGQAVVYDAYLAASIYARSDRYCRPAVEGGLSSGLYHPLGRAQRAIGEPRSGGGL